MAHIFDLARPGYAISLEVEVVVLLSMLAVVGGEASLQKLRKTCREHSSCDNKNEANVLANFWIDCEGGSKTRLVIVPGPKTWRHDPMHMRQQMPLSKLDVAPNP